MVAWGYASLGVRHDGLLAALATELVPTPPMMPISFLVPQAPQGPSVVDSYSRSELPPSPHTVSGRPGAPSLLATPEPHLIDAQELTQAR